MKVKSKTYKKSSNIKAPELFENISKALISARYSVSRVPISSGIILLITWAILFVGTLGIAESLSITASKYEVCREATNCVKDTYSMMKDLKSDWNLINGHYFGENVESTTQIIFSQINNK